MSATDITVTMHGETDAGDPKYDVKRGATFLASISFDGPRGTIRTHEGALRADERQAVYAVREAARMGAVKRPRSFAKR